LSKIKCGIWLWLLWYLIISCKQLITISWRELINSRDNNNCKYIGYLMKLVFRAINSFHAAFNTGNKNDKLLFYLCEQYNILNTMFKFKCISNKAKELNLCVNVRIPTIPISINQFSLRNKGNKHSFKR